MSDSINRLTKKTGRKKKEVDVQEMVRLAALGFTNIQIAEGLGMSYDTFRVRLLEESVLAEELKRARISANSVISNRLFEKAMTGDTTALIWWEKTRSGFSETHKLDIGGDQRFTIRLGHKKLAVERDGSENQPTGPELPELPQQTPETPDSAQ